MRGDFTAGRTSATSASTTGRPCGVSFTTDCDISSASLVESRPRKIYSLPYSYNTPPVALRVMACVASNTSERPTP